MSADSPRRIPRFLACLVKGPLGCLAFLAGATGVLVLLLPPAGGRLASRGVEDWFEDHHEGSVELGDAWIGSLYGPQHVESLILRDPNGDEVLRAEVRAPSFAELFDQDPSPYGPVLVRIPACRLTTTADGETNLLAALEEKKVEPDERRRGGLSTDRPFEVLLEIVVERLHWRDARGNQGVLDGLSFQGTLSFAPDGTRLSLAGGSDPAAPDAVRARIECTRPAFGPDVRWRPAVELEGLPSALAGLLVEGLEPLVACAGPFLDDVRWEREEDRFGLRVTDEGATFELTGAEDDDEVGGPGASARLALPCADPRASALLAHVVPLLDRLECGADAPEGAMHALRIEEVRWPLDGDWDDLSGDLQLELAPARGWLAVSAVERLGPAASGEPPRLSFDAGFRRSVRVEDGVLELALFRLPLEDGWIQLDGTLGLQDGTADLHVTGERAGAAFDLGLLAGSGGVLDPVVPEPPALPVEPGADASREHDG